MHGRLELLSELVGLFLGIKKCLMPHFPSQVGPHCFSLCGDSAGIFCNSSMIGAQQLEVSGKTQVPNSFFPDQVPNSFIHDHCLVPFYDCDLSFLRKQSKMIKHHQQELFCFTAAQHDFEPRRGQFSSWIAIILPLNCLIIKSPGITATPSETWGPLWHCKSVRFTQCWDQVVEFCWGSSN